MTGRTATVRESNWLTMLPHLLVLGGLCAVATFATGSGRRGPMIGAACYLAWSIGGRYIIPRDHRRGVQFTRARRWSDAQAAFEASYSFFSRNEWIDRFRAIVLLSGSRASYREMALLNIATCQLQQKQVEEAKATYRRILDEFPDSPVAAASLETIETVEAAKQ